MVRNLHQASIVARGPAMGPPLPRVLPGRPCPHRSNRTKYSRFAESCGACREHRYNVRPASGTRGDYSAPARAPRVPPARLLAAHVWMTPAVQGVDSIVRRPGRVQTMCFCCQATSSRDPPGLGAVAWSSDIQGRALIVAGALPANLTSGG